MLATITTSRQTARKSSGFLVRAAWANRLREQQPAEEQHARCGRRADRQGPEQRPLFRPSAVGAMAPSANTIGTSARSSNRSMPSAERPTAAVGADERDDDRGRGQGQRKAERDRAGSALADADKRRRR